ncbi:MAG: tRNA1(Val) (adenine(37)-N6)-methyltransferase [Treponema sp.]|nr:tRNA1(Val) (adenine(37)-N6)-methyltransferase [Treponema sp.]
MARLDTLTNGLKIYQDPKAFCFGVDAILLCAFAKLKRGGRAIDLGTGNGIIPLTLQKKFQCAFTGLEIQKEAADLAKKSVLENALQDRIEIVQGDIKKAKKLFEGQSFDAVLSNPPYMKVQGSKESESQAKRIARNELLCDIDDIASAASFLLKPNGTFFMVHRPYRLQEIFAAFEKVGLVARRARFVFPSADKAPEMILIEAKKNYKKDLKIEAPLVMYQGREYTKEFLEYVKGVS